VEADSRPRRRALTCRCRNRPQGEPVGQLQRGAIFQALDDSLRGGRSNRRTSQATERLVDEVQPGNAAFISFNYDVIIDHALATRRGRLEVARKVWVDEDLGDPQEIDYALDFANVERQPRQDPPFLLLKLHGSFNWLRSRVTGDLYYGGLRKAVELLFRTRPENRARLADLPSYRGGRTMVKHHEAVGDLEPVMVTPTQLKDLRNPHLGRIWRRAEECLRSARKVTFIGYSLPGDDLHVKYLFKRSFQTRPRGTQSPEIHVVDKDSPTSTVRSNYERFFGQRNVRYFGDGFDAWMALPKSRR
jgi:hypothetical protein